MIKLTHPLNKDGVLYEVGAILTLPHDRELELIDNHVAESFPVTLSKAKEQEDQQEVEVEKQSTSTRKATKSSTKNLGK